MPYPTPKPFKYVQGQISPLLRIAKASFNRPGDTTQYVAYDNVCPSGTPYYGQQLVFAPQNDLPLVCGNITAVKLVTNNPDVASVQFRLLFFNMPLAGVPADNAEFKIDLGNYWDQYCQGYVDLNIDCTDGAGGFSWGANYGLSIPFVCTYYNSLWLHVVSMKATYNPLSGQNFNIQVAANCSR